MPTSKELQQKINQFNKKYASNFSIEGYEKQILQARADAEAKKNGTLTEIDILTVEREVYKTMISGFCRRYAKKCILLRNLSNYMQANLLEEFNELCFAPYRETESGKQFAQNDIHRQFSVSAEEKLKKDGLQDFKDAPLKAHLELYQEGRLRIRDMRAEVARIERCGDNPNSEWVAEGLLFARVLKEANSQRSFWWKVFHPFRNHAEQRDANLIEEKMMKYIPEGKTREEVMDLLNLDVSSHGQVQDADWYKNYNPFQEMLKELSSADDFHYFIDEANDLDFDLDFANEDKEEALVNENEKEQISVEIEEPQTEISQPIQPKGIDEAVVSKSTN